MKIKIIGVLIVLSLLAACGDDDGPDNPSIPDDAVSLSIFFVNDPHGRIDNFAKVKHIVDEAKANASPRW